MRQADIELNKDYAVEAGYSGKLLRATVIETGVARFKERPGRTERKDGVIVRWVEGDGRSYAPITPGRTSTVPALKVKRPWSDADQERTELRAATVARVAALRERLKAAGVDTTEEGFCRDRRDEVIWPGEGGSDPDRVRVTLSIDAVEAFLERFEALS